MLFTVSSSPRTILDSLKDLVTDNGGIYISLTWVPKKLEPNTSSTMYLKFLNAQDNSLLSADITYGIKITDERGTLLLKGMVKLLYSTRAALRQFCCQEKVHTGFKSMWKACHH